MPSDQVRLLLVEDVPQVAQYVRGLLNAQTQVRLVDVISEGAQALAQLADQRPDVILVDALLQGRVKGMSLVRELRDSGLGIPVVVLTVPQHPVTRDSEQGIADVLAMPFNGYDLITKVVAIHKARTAATEHGPSRMVTVFAPKGGVGKTTLAFNLAVAAAGLGSRTVLVDGSIQFADVRGLLRVPDTAPSMLDLPTDRVAEADLEEVVWRDATGLDILLAPPRVEMAEMVLARDLEKTLSLLRRIYDLIIVDSGVALDEVTLSLLDQADLILEIVTYDGTTVRNAVAMAETFAKIGYPASKLRYLVNRADASAGSDRSDLAQRLGREPVFLVRSEGLVVVAAGNRGESFVTASPEGGHQRRRRDRPPARAGPEPADRAASRRRGRLAPGPKSRDRVSDPRPIGVFDSGVGGLTVLREILRRTPAESTIYLGDNARAPYGTRADDEVRAFSTEAIDALVERDVKAVVVACNTSTAVALADLRRRYDLPVLGVIRPGAVTAALTTRNRRVGVIATPATIRSHAYFNAIKDENPAVEVYEHATPAFVPMVEAGRLHGEEVERAVRDGLAPLLGERDPSGEFVFPLPAS
ncbi:MAG TPA: glutamate racemase, partial [Candidatus Binatus sp.]|nr:glutamate racemase [Candidatus Binatus sp.]